MEPRSEKHFSTTKRVVNYVLAALLPLVGFIVGLWLITRKDAATKDLGKNTLLVSVMALVGWCVVRSWLAQAGG